MTAAAEARVLESLAAKAATALSQPSASRTGEGVQAMADRVEAYVARLGASVRQVVGQKAPIVEGVLGDDPGLPTLLVYDLYDIQPAVGQPGWSVPPFVAAIAAGRMGTTG
ncbi:MAG: hypothetical protein ACREFP_16430 [Acetobacteraceae bacterium]